MHTVIVTLAVIAIVGYVIGRQLLGEPLRGKRLIALPAILAVVGAVDLGKSGHHPHAADIVLIVINGLLAAGIGLGQGRMMRLESRDGVLWGKMPVKSLWLWAALIVSHVAIIFISDQVHAHVAASSAPVLLLLGINRLAQAAIVAPRAWTAGIPFAAEKDGTTFLGGVFGTCPGQAGPDDTTSDQAPVPESQPGSAVPGPAAKRETSWAALGQQLVSSAGQGRQRRGGRGRRQERRDRRRR